MISISNPISMVRYARRGAKVLVCSTACSRGLGDGFDGIGPCCSHSKSDALDRRKMHTDVTGIIATLLGSTPGLCFVTPQAGLHSQPTG
jgi:hypothetical protein